MSKVDIACGVMVVLLIVLIVVFAFTACEINEGHRAELSKVRNELETTTTQLATWKKMCGEYAAQCEEYKEQLNAEQFEIISAAPVPEGRKSKERLPEGMTNTFRCMDYRKITNIRSDQYALQQECNTGTCTGIRYYNSGGTLYYCAALGSAYSRDIGDTWAVTLANGEEFNIILSDFKDDGTTDFFGHPDINYDGERCTNIIEFVVDMGVVPSEVVQAGTMSALEQFGGLFGNGGNVIEMKYTGRVWSQ